MTAKKIVKNTFWPSLFDDLNYYDNHDKDEAMTLMRMLMIFL